MGLKDTLKLIRDEIIEQEHFLGAIFKMQNIYKKYKNILLTILIVGIVLIVGTNINSYYETIKLEKSNEAFNTLKDDFNSKKAKKAIEYLKSNNQQLLDLAVFLQLSNQQTTKINFDEFKLEESKIDFIKSLSAYNKAIKNNDIKALDKLITNDNFILRDFALFNKALIQIKNKQYKKAKNTLEFVSEANNKNEVFITIKHFLLDK